jgi:hypothetical protein
MKKMELGSNKGIAGEYRLVGAHDVMSLTPFCAQWEGVAGSSRDAVHVTAITEDGREIALAESFCQEHACSYDKTYEHDEPTIGEQIAGLSVTALIFHRDAYCSYQDGRDEDYTEILYLTPPDYTKIRRRIEDRLRKSGNDEVFRLAVLAGVKIY